MNCQEHSSEVSPCPWCDPGAAHDRIVELEAVVEHFSEFLNFAEDVAEGELSMKDLRAAIEQAGEMIRKATP